MRAYVTGFRAPDSGFAGRTGSSLQIGRVLLEAGRCLIASAGQIDAARGGGGRWPPGVQANASARRSATNVAGRSRPMNSCSMASPWVAKERADATEVKSLQRSARAW